MQAMLRELASKEYDIPARAPADRRKTLQIGSIVIAGGLAGLGAEQRCDHGRSKISTAVQERLLAPSGRTTSLAAHPAAVVGGTRHRAAGRVVAFGDPPLPATPRIIRPVGADSPEERGSFLAGTR